MAICERHRRQILLIRLVEVNCNLINCGQYNQKISINFLCQQRCRAVLIDHCRNTTEPFIGRHNRDTAATNGNNDMTSIDQ